MHSNGHIHQDPRSLSLFAGMTAVQRQSFKDTFRRHTAAEAGANDAQLAALQALEKGFNSHFPAYKPHADGSLQVTYSSLPAATVTALVRPDGTLQVQA